MANQLSGAQNFQRNYTLVSALLVAYAGYGLGFLANILVARLLGVGGKGLFSLFQVTVAGVATFATLGLGHGQMFHSARNPDRLRHFMPNAYLAALMLAGGVGTAYVLSSERMRVGLGSLGWPVMFSALLLVPISSVLVFQRQYFLARHEYTLSKLNLAMTQALPAVVYAVLLIAGRVSIATLIAGFTAAQIVCCFGFALLTHRSALRPERPSWDFARNSFRFGILQYLGASVQFLANRMDFFLVAYFLGNAGLGIYSVAVGVTEITSRIPRELGTVLFPAFAAGRFDGHAAAMILRVISLLSFLIAALLFVVCGPVIVLLFGKNFAAAVPAFRWLLPGLVAWSTLEVTWNHVAAKGKPELGIPIFGAAALLDGVLDLFLLPRMGVVGASLASTLSYALAASLFAWIFCRRQGYSMREALLIQTPDIRMLRDFAARALTRVRGRTAIAPVSLISE